MCVCVYNITLKLIIAFFDALQKACNVLPYYVKVILNRMMVTPFYKISNKNEMKGILSVDVQLIFIFVLFPMQHLIWEGKFYKINDGLL